MSSIIPEKLGQPGTHVLVIGVSKYPHLQDGTNPTAEGQDFQIDQLTAAARSASEFAAWLMNDYHCPDAPLSSLRILLSPSEGEEIAEDIEPLLGTDFAATRANTDTIFGEFISACKSHEDNVAIVYVAGHGVQLTKHGAIVLLEDFAAANQLQKLHGAIDMAGVHGGMNAPGFPKRQFWFVDSCRQVPVIARRFDMLSGALTLDIPMMSGEVSPMFLAATTGEAAYARAGGRTLFFEALNWAFAGGAATGPRAPVNSWHVSVSQLIEHLPGRVSALAEAEGVEQSVEIAGKIANAVVHELKVVPSVDLTIELEPAGAIGASTGELAFDATKVVVKDFKDWPLHEKVKAGLYLLKIQADPPFQKHEGLLDIEPPEHVKTVMVNS